MTAYFDNAATTRVCNEAAEAALRAMTGDYGNPSAGYAIGRAAAELVERAREDVASIIGAPAEDVVFTSGGTESDNIAIFGAAERKKRRREKKLITSTVEHDAVRKTFERLERDGWEVVWLRPDSTGAIPVEAVREAVDDKTGLVSLMLVNNETGAVTDIAEITKIVRRASPEAIIHTDAVQGLLKTPISVSRLGVDMMSVSSHKIHGPKGAGALYIRRGLFLEGIFGGGAQERGIRPGTEPVPAICGFGAAARIGKSELESAVRRMGEIKERIRDGILADHPEAVFIGQSDAPHIMMVSLPGLKSEVIMNALSADGVYVGKGSACKKGRRSHVLEAMGLPEKIADGAIRISLSRMTTIEEADMLLDSLRRAAARLSGGRKKRLETT